MDMSHQILSRIDQLEANQAAIYHAAKRPTSWPLSIILGAALAGLVHFWAVPQIEQKHTPYLYGAVKQLKEWQHIAGTDLGLIAADTFSGGENRRPIAQSSRYSLIGLTEKQTNALMKSLLKTESAGRYYIENQYCYLGAWQFGATALAHVGLIKLSKLNRASKGIKIGRTGHCDFLHSSSNWVINGGHRTFLRDHKMQDEAFIRLANSNILTGLKKRVLRRNSQPSRIAGFVKAAHLIGSRRAIRWYKYGIDSKDGNGTRTSTYAKQGEQSVRGIQ